MLEEYAAEQIPQVCAKLRALSFDFALFSTNWLLCVFINCLPWDCVLRVLDILLVERDAQVPQRAAASRALHACMAAHARCASCPCWPAMCVSMLLRSVRVCRQSGCTVYVSGIACGNC